MKNKFKIIIIILMVYSFPVFAIEIKNIDMNVSVQSDGNAIIDETWSVSENNEVGYLCHIFTNSVYNDFYDINITNSNGDLFNVFSDFENYESIAMLKNRYKVYSKNADNYLCFGTNENSLEEYHLNYKISNFVVSFDDTFGTNIGLIQTNHNIEKININIENSNKISKTLFNYKNILKYETNVSFENILPNMSVYFLQNYESGEYSVLTEIGANFKYDYEKIIKKYEKPSIDSLKKETKSIWEYYNLDKYIKKQYIYYILIFIVLIFAFDYINKTIKKLKSFKKQKVIIIKDKNIKNNRISEKVPCNGDYYEIYFILTQFGLISENKLKYKMFLIVLVNWLKKNYIYIAKDKDLIINIENLNSDLCQNKIEKEFLRMITDCAGIGKKTTSLNEFSKWCYEHYDRIIIWFNKINEYEIEQLIYTEVLEKQDSGAVRNNEIKIYSTEKFTNDAKDVIAFKNYILKYKKNLKDNYLEVKLLNDYLLFCNLLDINDFAFHKKDINNDSLSFNYCLNITNKIISKYKKVKIKK